MSHPVISVREDVALADVAAILTRGNINRLPVLDDQGDKLVGILTRSDLVRAQVLTSWSSTRCGAPPAAGITYNSGRPARSEE